MLTRRPYILSIDLPALDLENVTRRGTPRHTKLPADSHVTPIAKSSIRGMVEVLCRGHRYALSYLELRTRAVFAPDEEQVSCEPALQATHNAAQ